MRNNKFSLVIQKVEASALQLGNAGGGTTGGVGGVCHSWIISVTNIQCCRHNVLHSVTLVYSVKDKAVVFVQAVVTKAGGLHRVLLSRKG